MRFLYKITNKINGKCYIGQTGNMEQRIRGHKRKYNNKSLIHKAFNKYGFNNFLIEVIAECSMNLIDKMEAQAIVLFDCFVPRGYNIALGGLSGNTVSPETKEKLRQISIKQFSDPKAREVLRMKAKGRIISEETKKKISLAGMGRTHSEATKIKMSQKQKGKLFTEEHRKNIGLTSKGRVWKPEKKKLRSESMRKKLIENYSYIENQICTECKENKPREDFQERQRKTPGFVYLNKICKKCCSAKEKIRWAKSQQRAV